MPDITNLTAIRIRCLALADDTSLEIRQFARDVATIAALLEGLTGAHNVLATRLDVHLRHAPTHTT